MRIKTKWPLNRGHFFQERPTVDGLRRTELLGLLSDWPFAALHCFGNFRYRRSSFGVRSQFFDVFFCVENADMLLSCLRHSVPPIL